MPNLKCPKCGSDKTTIIYGLKEMHCGGDKWCMSCGKIFDALNDAEKIVMELEKPSDWDKKLK